MRWLIGLAVALLAVLVIGVATAEPPPHGPRSVPAVPAAVVDAEHVQQHVDMTEQMRVMSHTGHMSDPMWGDMRTSTHIQAEERAQADIDRMLAR